MLLIINNWIHPKNKEGLEAVLNYLKIEYTYGSEDKIDDDKYKIIYNPCNAINVNNYKNKFFIFGPHFSVFPDEKLNLIDFKSDNHIYIMPSKWTIELWYNIKPDIKIDIKLFPFPVNTVKFDEIKKDKDNVMIYYKGRNQKELDFVVNFLKNKNINYTIFSYTNKYNEEDFINYLHNCRYAIIVDAHESQGFAVEEIMACNVPLLVWNVKYLSQEFGCNYPDYPATSIPYWDNSCGEYFYEETELEEKFTVFINNLDNYTPRQFILDNLSVEKCAVLFKELINIK